MTLNYYSIQSLSRQTNRFVTVLFYRFEHRRRLQKRSSRTKRGRGWEPLPRARVPEFRGYSDDYVCGNHCRVTRDAHAKAKNRRNQSSSTSALYLGFVSASLLLVGTLFHPPPLSLSLSFSLCRCTTYAYDCYPRIAPIASTRPGSFASNTYSANRVGLTLSPLKIHVRQRRVNTRYSSSLNWYFKFIR